MKKVLIIGGDATLCDKIISALELNNYQVDLLSYFYPDKINNLYNWKFLDLTSQENTESFINDLPNNYYDKIICASTYNSGSGDTLSTKREYLNEVFGKFIINYMILIRNLLQKITQNGQIVYISTISCNTPTEMGDYAAAKAALQAYVMSLSTKTKKNQAIFSIAPAMIYETVAFDYRDEDHSIEPIRRLIKKEEIAKIIIDSDKSYNGNTIIMNYDGNYRMFGYKQISVDIKPE